MGVEGARAIAAMLCKTKTLADLNVYMNDIGDDGAIAVSPCGLEAGVGGSLFKRGEGVGV